MVPRPDVASYLSASRALTTLRQLHFFSIELPAIATAPYLTLFARPTHETRARPGRHFGVPAMTPKHLTFAEAVERLAAQGGHRAALRAGRRRAAQSTSGQRTRLVEAHKAAAGVLRRAAGTSPARRSAARVPRRARLRRRPPRRTFGVGYAPDALGRADQAPARPRASPARSCSPPGWSAQGQRGADRPLPRPADVPDPRHHRRRRSASARASCSRRDQGRSTSTPPRRRSTRSRHVLYGVDLAKRDIARARTRRSSSRATPT